MAGSQRGDRSRGRGSEPGWSDMLLAGRSRSDKEADRDAQLRAMIVIGGVLFVLAWGARSLFEVAGLQFGWWVLPVFAPLAGWAFFSAVMGRCLRPVSLELLRWRECLAGAVVLGVVLWVIWPLWAGPAASAWKTGRGFGNLAKGAPHFPLQAILAASPVAMGMVVFVILALGMVIAPRVDGRERERPAPPPSPEPIRPALGTRRPPRWPS